MLFLDGDEVVTPQAIFQLRHLSDFKLVKNYQIGIAINIYRQEDEVRKAEVCQNGPQSNN
jgi:hypothetical protein